MPSNRYVYKKPTPLPTYPAKKRNCLKCSKDFVTIHNAFICDKCQGDNARIRGRLIQKTSSGRKSKPISQSE